jgi:glycosyltransferase involved in cell wall biosynthesis
VIHPPVDTAFFAATDDELRQPREHLLAVGRLTPYKRFDLALAVAARLSIPIVIVGGGPEEERLRKVAKREKARATFVGTPSDEELREIYVKAKALLFPGIEDFGLIPVEAQAAGVVVVGVDAGGVRDTVRPGVSGMLAPTQTVGDLTSACEQALERSLNRRHCRASAGRFSPARFRREVRAWVNDEFQSTA